MDLRPAWSEQFLPNQLPAVQSVPLLDGVSQHDVFGASRGAGVRVAIVDSGVENDHPAIGGAVQGWCAPQRAEDGTITLDLQPHDDSFGHGTACASIVRSLAPEVELLSVRVLGARLSGTAAVFTAGLRWAIEQGVQVVNLSLGTTLREYREVLYELADLAAFHNVVLVTAANNMPQPSYPSMQSSVISVAAIESDQSDTLLYNPRPPVDFGAPGINVPVAWRGGGTMTVLGNSYAAPHVTGHVARMLGQHRGLTPWQVKTLLRAISHNVRANVATDAPSST